MKIALKLTLDGLLRALRSGKPPPSRHSDETIA